MPEMTDMWSNLWATLALKWTVPYNIVGVQCTEAEEISPPSESSLPIAPAFCTQ